MSEARGQLLDNLVLSDVHLNHSFTKTGKGNFVLTRFYFSVPTCKSSLNCGKDVYFFGQESDIELCKEFIEPALRRDEDGDLVVERLSNHEVGKDVITIEHTLSTPLSSVGTQVWRGSLLLCDFLIHRETEFDGCVALELGGGVGLCSIVMARTARIVFCTDICEVLNICERNRIRNEDLFRYRSKDNPVMVVKELDFFKSSFALDAEDMCTKWTKNDREELNRISVIIASDVIYDDRLTDAFLQTVMKLFDVNPDAVLFLAMEKRLNFTLEALQVASPAYDYFTAKLEEMPINAHKVPTTFSQYFEYDRVKELELWQITRKEGK